MASAETGAPPSGSRWATRRALVLALGPALAALVIGLEPWFLALEAPLTPLAVRVLAVTLWTTVWWVGEPVPIPIASLLPAVLFPVLGIATAEQAAGYYSNHLILLLLGGFFIATALETWGLHRRIALTVLALVGASPRRLVFGFVLTAAVLSMWISNTATTVMLIPIALAVGGRVGAALPERGAQALSVALLLGIAYGANVGGTGTLIGTPPNLIFAQNLVEAPPVLPAIDFVRWLVFGLPSVLLFAPLIAFLLARVLLPVPAAGVGGEGRDVLRSEQRALGAMSCAERRVLAVFLAAAVLWTFKGNREVVGWSWLFISERFPVAQLDRYFTDSLVALVMAGLLFVLPSGNERGRPLLRWADVQSVPWGMLFLFGGGFAIAGGFESSQLSAWLGNRMGAWLALPDWLLVCGVATCVTFLTELTSNTASTALLMPILKSAALGAERHPLLLMLPAIIAVSYAFMLPVATAPNALVFGTGRVSIRTMVRCGLVLNLVGVLVVLVVVYAIALPVLGVR